MYYFKFIIPPFGAYLGFSVWNSYLSIRYINNTQINNFKYDFLVSLLGYLIFPSSALYLGIKLVNSEISKKYCLKN